MAENLGGKFATMSEEERRRFALEQEGKDSELDFDDPRGDHGRTKADLEDKDGMAALVDERRHEEEIRKARASKKPGGASPSRSE